MEVHYFSYNFYVFTFFCQCAVFLYTAIMFTLSDVLQFLQIFISLELIQEIVAMSNTICHVSHAMGLLKESLYFTRHFQVITLHLCPGLNAVTIFTNLGFCDFCFSNTFCKWFFAHCDFSLPTRRDLIALTILFAGFLSDFWVCVWLFLTSLWCRFPSSTGQPPCRFYKIDYDPFYVK